MNFYIIADIEGIANIVEFKESMPGGEDYEMMRKIMTQEVNAAARALLESGAERIVVNDFHGNGRNIIFSDLPREVELVRGGFRPTSAIDFADETFDGVLFIGAHAAGGTKGVMAHTYSGMINVFINNYLVSEFDILASYFGDLNVPAIFVSGDQTVCEQSQYLCKEIFTVATKKAINAESALCIHPAKIQTEIFEKTKLAVKKIKSIAPLGFKKPLDVEMNLLKPGHMEKVEWIPGVKKKDMNTINFKVKTSKDLLDMLYGILMLFPY